MGVFYRKGFYWIDFYDNNGKRHRKKVAPQKSVAQLVLKEIQCKIAKKEFLGIEDKKILFKEFVLKNFLPNARVRLSPTTFTRTNIILDKHLFSAFDCYLHQINRQSIENYIEKRAQEVKPATVNREFSLLRSILNYAKSLGFLKENPCKGVKELKEPPGRIRYLTREEICSLLWACDPETLKQNPYNAGRSFSKLLVAYLKPIVLVALYTGMRRSEIINLKWEDINFKEKKIFLEKTKNGERRIIPMPEIIFKTFKSLPRQLHSNKVFPDINGNMVTAAFERACKRAGISDFRFHDLRHTFASYLTMSGANLRLVQNLLGHKDLRMTIRYSHLSPEHLQEAVNTLEKVLAREEPQKLGVSNT